MSRRKQDRKQPTTQAPTFKIQTEEDKVEEEEEEGKERRENNEKRQVQTERKAERSSMSAEKRLVQIERKAERGGMNAVKQTTLLTYHRALEDSVDLDKIWDPLQPIFDHHEQDQIQRQDSKKTKMKKLLDLLVNKDDEAFDSLVSALQPDYHWLALRLQQGMKEEERRINKLGKGIKRKVALSLLTVRISERQKYVILDRVTSVVKKEMTQKANRVNVPDYRIVAQLDHEHKMLQDLIQNEVDPLLLGEEVMSSRNYEDEEDTLESLKTKLEHLQTIRQCYDAFNVGKNASTSLPSLLLEKIEEVKSKVKILQKEKQAALGESQRLIREKQEQQQSLSRLEQHNRNLEMENRTLESNHQWLERTLQREREERKDLDKHCQKTDEENRDLRSEIQQTHDRLSALRLRNKSLDNYNTKLTRENLKLSGANTTLRKEVRSSGARETVRAENKRLTSEISLVKKDLLRIEMEKRQLGIRFQKLESQNRSLREQRRRLMMEKKRSQDENRTLKTEAKRLALGKYSPLPPIMESRESEHHHDQESLSRDVTPLSQESSPRNTPSRQRSASTDEDEPRSTKYTEDNTDQQSRGEAGANPERKKTEAKEKDQKQEEEEKEMDQEKTPGHMKTASSSQKQESTEKDGRNDTSPRRAVARK